MSDANIIEIELVKNKIVEAHFDGYTVVSDQMVEDGGDGIAPAPFSFFLASIGLCAANIVRAFCNGREISTDGLKIRQINNYDDRGAQVEKITFEIDLPKGFPQKYEKAIQRAVNSCSVKKNIQNAPEFEVVAKISEMIYAN